MLDREVVSEIVGDHLFTDTEFLNHLSTKHRNVFLKIFDEVKYLCKIATKGSKEARELEKLKREFERAYREGVNVEDDGEIEYSVSKDIDKYTEKQYNDFGWARVAEAITKNELDDMYSKIQEKGSLKKFAQSSNGEAIIEVNDRPHTTLGVNNKFLFVIGTETNPEITRVVSVNFSDEDSIDVFRKDIYEHSDHISLETLSYALGEKVLKYYDRNNSENYRGF